MTYTFDHWVVLWSYELDIEALYLLCPSARLRQQTFLYRPLRISFRWQFFNLIHITGRHYILRDAHGKSQHANHTEHVLIIIEKSRFWSEQDSFVSGWSQAWSRTEKLCLLHVTAMHLKQFPMVSIGLYDSCILNLRIDIAHVLKAPQASADSLRKWETLTSELWADAFRLDWKEDRYHRKAYAAFVVLFGIGTIFRFQFFCEVIDSEVISTISLV